MPHDAAELTPVDYLLSSITQAHHNVLETMLRADVILLPYQRQGLCKALDALRKAHGTLIEASDIRATTRGVCT